MRAAKKGLLVLSLCRELCPGSSQNLVSNYCDMYGVPGKRLKFISHYVKCLFIFYFRGYVTLQPICILPKHTGHVCTILLLTK